MQSSNMSSIESRLCGICQEEYNDSNRAPRVVCSKIHNVCSECLGKLLKTSGKKFNCPFDRLESDKKPLYEYPINIDLLYITQDLMKTSTHKNCSRCSDQATRLCLECNEIQCNNCILDYHEDHKKLKLIDVPRVLTEKKNLLHETIVQIEVSISGQEGIKRSVENKENELKEKADAIFENFQRILENQKQALKSEIKERLADLSSDFLAKKPQKNKMNNDEILKWINETKRITHPEMLDYTSVLCGLYKQEELLKTFDMSKLKVNEPQEDLLFNNVLNRISLECNELLLENFKRNNLVKFEHDSNFIFEEAKLDLSSFESSAKKLTNGNISFKDSESETNYHSEHLITGQNRDVMAPFYSRNQLQQNSKWIKKDFKSEQDPIQEEIQQFRQAFKDADLEIQVKFVKVSTAIRLDSVSDKIRSASGGFRSDEEVSRFYNVISRKELASSLKRVISLNLTCINLTMSGIIPLSRALEELSSLEVLRIEFFKSGELKHEDLKPFMQTLGRSKNLSTLSLSCQKWKYLHNLNLAYTIGDLALISKLKNLTLNFSECHNLTIRGIAEAFSGFSSFVSLEDLKLSFNGCSRVDNDEDSLKSIYQVYSYMKTLRKIEFEFLRCPGFTERSVKNLMHPSKVRVDLIVQVNR